MTDDQKKAKENLSEMVDYFKRCTQEWDGHIWWKREYEVVSKIVQIIYATDNHLASDFSKIALCINKLVGQEHYNGSGWMDFQIKISKFFRTSGYDSDWESTTGEFKFWKY